MTDLQSGLPYNPPEGGRPIVRIRGRSREAQRCPICMGRGIMPSTFYQPIIGTASAIVDEQCRSCEGKGVVIVDVWSVGCTDQDFRRLMDSHEKLRRITERDEFSQDGAREQDSSRTVLDDEGVTGV